jgi:hypothetical protein
MLPTSSLPWAPVLMPATEPGISGLGWSPTGLVEGSLVSGIFKDPGSWQEPIVCFTNVGHSRNPFLNTTMGFNDPNGIYPILGSATDVSPRASNIDVQNNPMENQPVNAQVNNPQTPVAVPTVNGKYFSLEQYFKGRDKAYPNLLTPALVSSATDTTNKVNQFLAQYFAANPNAKPIVVNSGWRPPAVNGSTPGAATRSNHLICKAVDISDHDSALDRWSQSTAAGLKCLADIGLWMESASSTPGWAHYQIVAPASGNRIFNP